MKKNVIVIMFVSFVVLSGCVVEHYNAPVRTRSVVYVESAPPPEPEPVVIHSVVAVTPKEPPKHNNRVHSTSRLIEATGRNDLNAVRTFISHRDNVNEIVISKNYQPTALNEAVSKNHLNIMRYLIDHGAKVNSTPSGEPLPLQIAVRKRYYEAVKLLVDNGAKTSINGILQESVYAGATNILEYLTRSISARNVSLFRQDLDLALLKAAKIGNANAARILIRAGANPDIRDSRGRGIIFYAIESNNHEVLEFAVNSSRSMINHADADGYTPLMIAAQFGSNKGVIFLIQSGARLDMRDKHNRDAIGHAKNKEIEKYLRDEHERNKKPNIDVHSNNSKNAHPDKKIQQEPPKPNNNTVNKLLHKDAPQDKKAAPHASVVNVKPAAPDKDKKITNDKKPVAAALPPQPQRAPANEHKEDKNIKANDKQAVNQIQDKNPQPVNQPRNDDKKAANNTQHIQPANQNSNVNAQKISGSGQESKNDKKQPVDKPAQNSSRDVKQPQTPPNSQLQKTDENVKQKDDDKKNISKDNKNINKNNETKKEDIKSKSVTTESDDSENDEIKDKDADKTNTVKSGKNTQEKKTADTNNAAKLSQKNTSAPSSSSAKNESTKGREQKKETKTKR
ncbi:MAG: ankyrin repeat domain-containing protein [Endomicrobium sp.]|jgi:ankyrin repeat protein|nr:ankyrin repeat domain-containing protein [Endomicrobium sp.]